LEGCGRNVFQVAISEFAGENWENPSHDSWFWISVKFGFEAPSYGKWHKNIGT
jgi:hypothetical protein